VRGVVVSPLSDAPSTLIEGMCANHAHAFSPVRYRIQPEGMSNVTKRHEG
jgi:hypothetical protein